jgi:hypothetical protein
MEKYSEEVVLLMQKHYATLNEKQKRHYATIESMKLGWGGQSYIRRILGVSRMTLLTGKKTLESGLSDTSARIRVSGGGRKKKK